MERLVEVAAAPGDRARTALHRPHAGRAGRGAVTDRPIAPARPLRGHNKVVNFSGVANPGEIVPVEITSGDESQTLFGRGVAALTRRLMLPWPSAAAGRRRSSPCGPGEWSTAAMLAAFADPRSSASRTGSPTTRRAGAVRYGASDPVRARRAADAVLGGASLYGFVEGRRGRLLARARSAGPGVATRAVRCSRAGRSTLGVAGWSSRAARQRRLAAGRRALRVHREGLCARTCRSRAGAATPCSTACSG